MINVFDILCIKIKRVFCRDVFKSIINKLRHILMNKAAVAFSAIRKANQHVFCLFVISNVKVHVSKIVSFELINHICHFQFPEIISETIILGLNQARGNKSTLACFFVTKQGENHRRKETRKTSRKEVVCGFLQKIGTAA